MKQIHSACIILTIILSSLNFTVLTAQSSGNQFQIGGELQWYPAGWIAGPGINYFINPNNVLNFRAAVNVTNRYDWSGLNDDEKGTGFGVSLGYRYLFNPERNSLFLAARTDLWRTNINWKNNIGTLAETKGSTTIIVLQPTVELGYWIKLKQSKWDLLFSGGGGMEINVHTKGKQVGEGGIWLLSAAAYYDL